jgi:hypothetical protein
MVTSWEFPVLLKYTLPSTPSLGRLRPFVEAGPSFRANQNATAAQPSQYGLSVGAGLAFLRARNIEIGAIVGFPFSSGLSPTVRSAQIAERFRYLAGVTAQVNLVSDFSPEIDGLYKPLRAKQLAAMQERFSVITWQFPVLAKYRWNKPLWTPFAEAGPTFRLAGNLNGYNPSHTGITSGGGLEAHTLGVRLAPALRYTSWVGDKSGQAGRLTNPNALELVFGITF